MTVDIKGIHGYGVGDSTRAYVDKKMKRLDYLKEHIADLHFIFSKHNNGEYTIETNIHFRWGVMGHNSITDRNLFKAIDTMFDKIEQKATKEKNKIQSH